MAVPFHPISQGFPGTIFGSPKAISQWKSPIQKRACFIMLKIAIFDFQRVSILFDGTCCDVTISTQGQILASSPNITFKFRKTRRYRFLNPNNLAPNRQRANTFQNLEIQYWEIFFPSPAKPNSSLKSQMSLGILLQRQLLSHSFGIFGCCGRCGCYGFGHVATWRPAGQLTHSQFRCDMIRLGRFVLGFH